MNFRARLMISTPFCREFEALQVRSTPPTLTPLFFEISTKIRLYVSTREQWPLVSCLPTFCVLRDANEQPTKFRDFCQNWSIPVNCVANRTDYFYLSLDHLRSYRLVVFVALFPESTMAWRRNHCTFEGRLTNRHCTSNNVLNGSDKVLVLREIL